MGDYGDMGHMGGNGMGNGFGFGMTSFVWGAVVGAGIALLLAPAEGRETRRRLRGSLQGLKEKAEGGMEKVKQQARHVGDGVKEGMDAFRRGSEQPGQTGTPRP
jgi:gas vesicle protein